MHTTPPVEQQIRSFKFENENENAQANVTNVNVNVNGNASINVNVNASDFKSVAHTPWVKPAKERKRENKEKQIEEKYFKENFINSGRTCGTCRWLFSFANVNNFQFVVLFNFFFLAKNQNKVFIFVKVVLLFFYLTVSVRIMLRNACLLLGVLTLIASGIADTKATGE